MNDQLEDDVTRLIAHLLGPGLDAIGKEDRAVVAILIAVRHAVRGETSLEDLAMACIAFDRGELEIEAPGEDAP